MYIVYRKRSPHKIRDINITIAYHNTGRTLKSVAKEYEMSSGNVERIHHTLVKHISRCVGLDDVYFHTKRKNHSEKMSVYLQEYKYLLEENELKTEITLNNEIGLPAIILSTCMENEYITLRVFNELDERKVSLEDLKAAIRKLSVK